MKKHVKTIVVLFICITMLFAASACNEEEKYAKKLQNLGYDVEIYDYLVYEPEYSGGYRIICAEKEGKKYECVYIDIFENEDDAKIAYSKLWASKNHESVLRNGKVVFYGTISAVYDARN